MTSGNNSKARLGTMGKFAKKTESENVGISKIIRMHTRTTRYATEEWGNIDKGISIR